MAERFSTHSGLVSKNKETDIIKSALRVMYPQAGECSLRQLVRESVFAPPNRLVIFQNFQVRASDLKYQLAHMIDAHGLLKAEYFADHADNAEEEDTSEEYFYCLEKTTNIINHMNDGYVSEEDLTERNDFLNMLDRREAELMLSMCLYQSSRSMQAPEQMKIIRYKVQKLREMRSAIEQRTRDESGVEIIRAEYNLAIPYYKYFKGLQKVAFGYDISREQKVDLNINHDDDYDLQEEYNHKEHLRNIVLNEMKEEDFVFVSQEFQLLKDMNRETYLKDVKKISDKIQELYGRKNSFSVEYAILEEQ